MAHFLPLPKLPMAKETAKLMLQHIFRLHGFPADVVSDRGPQFSSVFWREFCTLVGATVSLTSGFHPQSNGQTERMNQEMETSMLITLCPAPPLACLLFSVAMVFNRLCSQWRRKRLHVPQSSPSFNTAVGPGAEPGLLSSMLSIDTPLQRIDGDLKRPYT
ncbi:hypothetical protein LDENG_00123100, partial [Lucifuga dentata]